MVDNYTYAICGDGCLRKAYQPKRFLCRNYEAGKTDSAMTETTSQLKAELRTFDEDVGKRFEAYGWQVLEVLQAKILMQYPMIAEAKSERINHPYYCYHRYCMEQAGKASTWRTP